MSNQFASDVLEARTAGGRPVVAFEIRAHGACDVTPRRSAS
jgi:hypothetical protein